MHAKPNFALVSSIMSVAATLAAVSAIGFLSVIVNHFKRRGAPIQRPVAAERAYV
jgi:hypothetical protein